MDALKRAVQAYKKNTFLKKGIPFVLFVCGGSFFLKQFSTLRYEFRKGKEYSREEMEKLGIKMSDPEEETLKMMQQIKDRDPDDWDNIRGPRPWEDSQTMQEAQRQKIREAKEAAQKLAEEQAATPSAVAPS